MIDTAIVGTTIPATTTDIERGRLLLFAKAIGETNPVYLDVQAARQAGHPDVLVPPTFLTGLSNEDDSLMRLLIGAGADLRRLLHGEQGFRYHRPTYAGRRVTMQPSIGDVYQKKSGALEFVVVETAVKDEAGVIAELRSLLVFTNPGDEK